MQQIIIEGNQAGQRFDKFLIKLMPEAGSGFLHKMLRKKNITLNGKKAEGNEILSDNDIVRFFFSDETFNKFTNGQYQTASNESAVAFRTEEYDKAFRLLKGITVIYEDADFLFLNKPAGILSQKAESKDLSINEWMIGYLIQQNRSYWEKELFTFKPSVANRLDRNTSGIILCGKTLAGSQYLSKCIKDRSVRKFYRTVCIGEIKKEISLSGYLVKDTKTNKVTVSVQTIGDKSDRIETKAFPLSAAKGHTYLEVELITGKTHQIRAHMASIGHSLIGDSKYGNAAKNTVYSKSYHLQHQLLHAHHVTFPLCEQGVGSTLSGKTFQAPISKQFSLILKDLTLKEV